jgi:hypothetical protein
MDMYMQKWLDIQALKEDGHRKMMTNQELWINFVSKLVLILIN